MSDRPGYSSDEESSSEWFDEAAISPRNHARRSNPFENLGEADFSSLRVQRIIEDLPQGRMAVVVVSREALDTITEENSSDITTGRASATSSFESSQITDRNIENTGDLEDGRITVLLNLLNQQEAEIAMVKAELDAQRDSEYDEEGYNETLENYLKLLMRSVETSEETEKKLQLLKEEKGKRKKQITLECMSVESNVSVSENIPSFVDQVVTESGLISSDSSDSVEILHMLETVNIRSGSCSSTSVSASDIRTFTPVFKPIPVFPRNSNLWTKKHQIPPSTLVPTGIRCGNPPKFAEFPDDYKTPSYCDCGQLEYLKCRTAWLDQTRLLCWQSRRSDALIPGIIRDFRNPPPWFPKARLKWTQKLQTEATAAVDNVLQKFLGRWLNQKRKERLHEENVENFDFETVPDDISELLYYYEMYPLKNEEHRLLESQA